MSDLVNVEMRFADDGERQRYSGLRNVPEMRAAAGMGVYVARHHVLPQIRGNRGVFSAGQLAEMSVRFLELGLKDAAAAIGRELSDDERFCFQMAYQALTLRAMEEHLRTGAEPWRSDARPLRDRARHLQAAIRVEALRAKRIHRRPDDGR